MSKKILFWPDVYKEQGHWLPTLTWAKGLFNLKDDEGNHRYDVAYMGIADCESIVKSFAPDEAIPDYRFPYFKCFSDLYPSGYTDECLSSISERWKPEHVLSIMKGELDYIFEEFKPDLLVSGYFTSLESLLIHYLYDIPVVITTTYLRHPQDDPAMRAIQNLKAFSEEEFNSLLDMFQEENLKRIYKSLDFFNFKKNFEKYSPIDPSLMEEFVRPLETFPELIPCPRVFQTEHLQYGALVHFVEPCITDEFLNTDSDIDWDALLGSHDKIIFMTAGSQVLDYEKKAEKLFDEMIKAMAAPQMQDYHLILGVGHKLLRSKDWGSYSNVTVAGWVPQRRLLSETVKDTHGVDTGVKKVRCALIHGGLATIKECIYYNVNFIILPLGKDQMDNALCLQEKGIENMAYAEFSRSECLLFFINKALTDYRTQQNIAQMSKIFVSTEASHPGLLIIAVAANNP